KFEYMDIFIKPLISSVGMAIVVRLSYISLLNLLGSGLSTIVSVIIGIIVYSILLIITGTITNEDLALMPKGDVISEKINKFKFEYMDIFIKPLISSVGMAIVVRLSYISLLNLLGSGLSTIVSVIIGIIVYSILLIITGTITNEDLALMPKGDVISEKINKFKLLK